MAADVSSLVRVINGFGRIDSATSGKSTAPISSQLLEGCCTLGSKELESDFSQSKSGKVHMQRENSSYISTLEDETQHSKSMAKFEDLNFPPSSKQTLNLFADSSLDLKLVSSSISPSSSKYQCVCTLDKVKSALERAEKETVRKRSLSLFKSSSPRATSSSTMKDSDLDIDQEVKLSASFAAGCPTCLLYVLISSSNPNCPRCNSNDPLPTAMKKPRIDLNISI